MCEDLEKEQLKFYKILGEVGSVQQGIVAVHETGQEQRSLLKDLLFKRQLCRVTLYPCLKLFLSGV